MTDPFLFVRWLGGVLQAQIQDPSAMSAVKPLAEVGVLAVLAAAFVGSSVYILRVMVPKIIADFRDSIKLLTDDHKVILAREQDAHKSIMEKEQSIFRELLTREAKAHEQAIVRLQSTHTKAWSLQQEEFVKAYGEHTEITEQALGKLQQEIVGLRGDITGLRDDLRDFVRSHAYMASQEHQKRLRDERSGGNPDE